MRSDRRCHKIRNLNEPDKRSNHSLSSFSRLANEELNEEEVSTPSSKLDPGTDSSVINESNQSPLAESVARSDIISSASGDSVLDSMK